MKYFSYDSDSGFETHNTKGEAIKAASDMIDYYRDNASEGWSDEVDSVCWGVISQESVQSEPIEVTEEIRSEICISPDVSHMCDYGLEDVK
ncbi:MAG: hypothetical protein Tp185DCM00d2C31949991_11 [Prokaryotic dsDNA virus sp.]|nr:MAG: hypothetical protein Tp162SUR1511541_57 [Prokaryotic dsDNA virus sp.]QDP56723.1 MAG: hypothetical protein Tp185DCM00d2C31949991_11 [Prokaryotic dsDNA virus sp.]QDP63759.1 MAG: hypothetical protein Unbinned2480contig1002_13 [Prokaryotic dsDNA virus sp.]QDP63827.1 MAG: hypothetical protein GOVbin2429_11 [Prokaryotic dsDNA virus sp.]|tara:strand:+ start:36716 stop:36988 length:273 start_codon:yes stop_codon:yes gene_type:complete